MNERAFTKMYDDLKVLPTYVRYHCNVIEDSHSSNLIMSYQGLEFKFQNKYIK